jgi:hypothetical protein
VNLRAEEARVEVVKGWQDAERRYRLVLGTSSWRLTRPLRAVGNALRRR